MKWADIKNKSAEELDRDLAEARARLVELRFKAQSGGLKQVHQIRQVRRDVSRILTRMHEIRHTNDSAESEAAKSEKA